MPVPCSIEVLPDGTCQFGMPEILPENRLAINLFSDLNSLGWECARDLHNLTLTDHERGELLMKMRTLADEVNVLQQEKYEAEKRKSKAS